MFYGAPGTKVENLPGFKLDIKEIAYSRSNAGCVCGWLRFGEYVIAFCSDTGCNHFDNDWAWPRMRF